MSELAGEDAKLVVLARAARGRAHVLTAVPEGAAVRDTDGRTYSAATVDHADPMLATSALRGAVVAAVSSGARAFEAAAVVGDAGGDGVREVALLAAFGAGVPVLMVDPDGTVRSALPT